MLEEGNGSLQFATQEQLELVSDVGSRYRSDAGFRARVDGGDVSDLFDEFGFQPVKGIEYRFLADSADTVHFVLPPDPNVELTDEMLNAVAGGSCASTAGTIGSASSILTFTSISSVSSSSSVGTAGSAG